MPEHFIPFHRADLIRLASTDPRLPEDQRPAFTAACTLITQLFHHEFHQRLEQLKEAFAPLDPNSEARPIPGEVAASKDESRTRLWASFRELLTRANFTAVSDAELQHALNAESVFDVKLHTKLDDFAELMIFARGRRRRQESVKRRFGTKVTMIDVDYFERAVICLRFQEAAHFTATPKRKLPFTAGATTIKLFENVPVADLEMVFPNSEVRMRAKDHAILWIPAILGGIGVVIKAGLGIVAIALLAWSMISSGGPDHKLGAAEWAAISAGALGLLAIGGFVFRQWGRFKNKKIAFMQSLSQSLYFKNLDNNAGVFHRLIDDAEEEEVKEAVLAWFFLLICGPATMAQLDDCVEQWFERKLGTKLDFEVDDALAKVERLGLATRDGDRWIPVQPTNGVAVLGDRWRSLAG